MSAAQTADAYIFINAGNNLITILIHHIGDKEDFFGAEICTKHTALAFPLIYNNLLHQITSALNSSGF